MSYYICDGNNILDSVDPSGDDDLSDEWFASVPFPEDAPEDKRFVSLFVGYFDDSGRREGDGDAPIAVLGGFVARPMEWLGFNHQWKRILAKYGVEMHHQNKWSNKAPPFDDPEVWPSQRRFDYMNELIDLITKRDVVTIGAAVAHERFDAHFGRPYMSPFGYAAQCVFEATAKVVKDRVPDAQIAYIFESGIKEFAEIKRTFDACKETEAVREQYGLVTLTDGDKRDFMQLQAADVMAYEVFKLFERGDDKEALNPRYPLRQIGKRMGGMWTTPSEDALRTSAKLQDLVRAMSELGLLG